jgi:hypothetical protein
VPGGCLRSRQAWRPDDISSKPERLSIPPIEAEKEVSGYNIISKIFSPYPIQDLSPVHNHDQGPAHQMFMQTLVHG